MANERLKKRKQNAIYRTAGNIVARRRLDSPAGIPLAQAISMTIHSRKKNYRGKYRPKRGR